MPLPNYDRGDDEENGGNADEYDDRNMMVKTLGSGPCQRRRSRPVVTHT